MIFLIIIKIKKKNKLKFISINSLYRIKEKKWKNKNDAPETRYGCRDRKMVSDQYNVFLDEKFITCPDELVKHQKIKTEVNYNK